jgi:hypothetical protein
VFGVSSPPLLLLLLLFFSFLISLLLQWDNFMHQMEPLVSAVPYMTTHGNHERDWPNSGDRFTTAYDSGGRRSRYGLTQALLAQQQCVWHQLLRSCILRSGAGATCPHSIT